MFDHNQMLPNEGLRARTGGSFELRFEFPKPGNGSGHVLDSCAHGAILTNRLVHLTDTSSEMSIPEASTAPGIQRAC